MLRDLGRWKAGDGGVESTLLMVIYININPTQVSPPITGGLNVGAPIHCDTFPIAWGNMS